MMPTMNTLTIATRQSPLALWQAHFVKDQLQKHHPNLTIHLLEMTTRGDKILDTPLAKIGGKGLFVKELETALFDKQADIAVHSLKDVPMIPPHGLIIGAYLSRHAPTDAFVSNTYERLDQLPAGAIVGTSSLRRECQLKTARPDLIVKSLRGNVGTRLSKLDDGDYDAIILATSGLQRLGLQSRIRHELDTAACLPAVGQGVLAIECRCDDTRVLELIRPLHDDDTALCVTAERAMNRALEGGCQVPIAGFATLEGNTLHLEGRVGTTDGSTLLIAKDDVTLMSDDPSVAYTQARTLGEMIAKHLLNQGADKILQALYQDGTPS